MPLTIIDPVTYAAENSGNANPFLFRTISAWYAVLFYGVAIPFGQFIAVFKSTDQGVTWNAQDFSGGPANGGDPYVYFDENTGIAAIKYSWASDSYIQEFDTNTDTWGPPSSPLSPGFGISIVNLYKLGSDYVIICNPTATDLVAYTCTSGTWTGPTPVLSPGGGAVRPGSLVDATGTTHFLTVTASPSSTIKYQHVDSSLFPLSPTTLYSGSVSNGSQYRPSILLYSTDSVIVAYTTAWSSGSTGNTAVHFVIGSPLSGPIFTDVPINTETRTGTLILYPTVAIGNDGTTIRVYWSVVSSTIGQIWFRESVDGGITFGAAGLFYDMVANPPTDFDSSRIGAFPASLQSWQDSLTSDWVVSTQLPILNGDGLSVNPQFIVPLNGVTVACPVTNTGTVGDFFTATIQASGGVPPYAFSIGGSVPPGLTLTDAVNGTIAGTPAVAGSFGYTISVVDSTGTTDGPHDCTLVISALPPATCEVPPVPPSPGLTITLEAPEQSGS